MITLGGNCDCCCPQCNICLVGCGQQTLSLQAEVAGITQIIDPGECSCTDLNTTCALTLTEDVLTAESATNDYGVPNAIASNCGFGGQLNGSGGNADCVINIFVWFVTTTDDKLYAIVTNFLANSGTNYQTILVNGSGTTMDCTAVDILADAWDVSGDGTACSAPTSIHVTSV